MSHLGLILGKAGGIKLQMDVLIATINATDENLHEAGEAETQAGIALTSAFDTLSTWVDVTQLAAVSCVEDFQAASIAYEKSK